jgi:hypothetical protein
MLKVNSFQTIAVTEGDEITLHNAVSRIAVPITATARLTSSKPQSFSRRMTRKF